MPKDFGQNGGRMAADDGAQLEARAGLGDATTAIVETREYLTTQLGRRLAGGISQHLRAYAALDELVPYYGDHRLPYTEASFQLKNSVCLAYSGLYSQAFATLRSVCELSLLQVALPEGPTVSQRQIDLLRATLLPDAELPGIEEVNWVLPIGFGARQSPDRAATTLEEWAVDGCRTPRWAKMFDLLCATERVERHVTQTQLRRRFEESMGDLDSYVHARGRVRTAAELCACNAIRFREETLSQFSTRMMCAVQVSVSVLLVELLPSATTYPNAPAGFIGAGQLELALRVLPVADANLFRELDAERRRRGESV